MKNLQFLFIAFIMLLFGLGSCSTDVELNAPYDSRSIVYGFLDAQADTQFIKLTKTFLGDGNNLDYALVRDSSEYPFSVFEQLEIQEVLNGDIVNTHPLDTLTIDNKEVNGIFYAPEQTIYYFETPEEGLNDDAIYRFVATFNNGEDPLLSETDIIETNEVPNGTNSSNVVLPNPFLPNMNELAGINSVDNETFPNLNFRWNTTDGASRYEVRLRFYYTEVEYTDDTYSTLVSSEVKSLDWPLGQYETSSTAGNEEINIQVNGESFYRNIRSRMEVIPAEAPVRRFVGYILPDEPSDPQPAFDFLLSVANEELDIFIEVTSPVTGVVQERPAYSNIANGLGIFASKATQGVYDLLPQKNTITYMYNMFEQDGNDDLSYGFFSRDPRFANEPFYRED